MAALDDLIDARLATPSAAPATGIDALVNQRLSGTLPKPAASAPGGFMSQLSDFGSALGHHVLSGLHGGAQLVENSVAASANLLPDNPVSRAISSTAASDNKAIQDWEAKYQASTPNSAGAYTGATVGEVLPFLAGGAAGKLNDAGKYVAGKLLPDAAPLAQKMASGATQGAIVGAAQPVTTPPTMPGDPSPQGSYWQQKAAQILGSGATGGILPAAGSAISGGAHALWNAAKPVLNPSGVVAPLMSKMVGDSPEALNALSKPQQIVPGSMPTTAQILATPEAVATEKAFANTSPAFKNQLANQANTNNAARMDAVQGLTGAAPDDALAAAIKARKVAALPWTDPTTGTLATGKQVDATPILNQLSALGKSSLGMRPAIESAASDMADSIKRAGTTDPNTGITMIGPGHLDVVRQNVRDFLAKYPSNHAVGSQQDAAFEPVRSAIVDSIEGANPGYRAYLAGYAKNSVPINTMEAARSIADNVGSAGRGANSSGTAQVTLPGYSAALAKALKNSPYGIDPEAQKTFQAVQQDLQRESISNSLRSPGSDTAYNLNAPGWLAKQLYGENFGGTPGAAKGVGAALGGLGGWFTGGGFGAAGGATAGAAAMGKLGQLGQSRVNDIMARALSDPEFAAQLAAQARKTTPPGAVSNLIPQLQLLR